MPESSSQKIFDIVPPERIEKKIPFRKEVRKREPRQPRSKLPLKIFFIIILLLFFGIVTSHFIFQKAEIVIWPKTQTGSFEEKVTVDLKANQVNLSTNTIPGAILEGEERISQESLSSGRTIKETKAEGTIRVYNAYSTSAQVLVATTRFVSADGKLFRSLERVVIPGGTYKGGELQPGFIDIRVRADRPGEDYNIGPSTFSIPGFAGTARYTAFYGKSSDPMKGGFRGETLEITEKDLEKAENTLKDKLLEAVRISLKNRASEEIIILEEASEKEFSAFVFSAKAGEERDSFVGEGKLSFKALAFKRLDLENFAKDYIASQLAKDQKLDLKSLKIDYFSEGVNLEQGKMVLNLEISAKTYFEILEKDLKAELAGKSLSEAEKVLTKDPRITKAEISLWPFWLKKIPQAEKKIKIEQGG
jgi:hypothetical protein